MKKFGMVLMLTLLTGVLQSCTNDEGDPEFDTLTPNEEQTQAKQDGEVD